MADPKLYAFDQSSMARAIRSIKTTESVSQFPSSTNLASSGNAIILAKLTSRDTTDTRLYAWSEARATATSFEVINQGLKGTVGTNPKVPAMDITDAASREDMTNAYVLLNRSIYMKSQLVSDGMGGHTTKILPAPCFQIFGFPPTDPQYQYMVLQGVSANQRGWDFQRAHAIFNP